MQLSLFAIKLVYFSFYSKVCYYLGLSGSGNLASGVQAAVRCAMKGQGARLAVTLSQSDLNTLKPPSSSDKYWMGEYVY